jgi:predicted ATPase with chaperone activity
MALAEVASATTFERTEGWQPPPVSNIADTGLTQGFLADMSLKIMYVRGQITGGSIAAELRLPFQAVIYPVLSFLRQEQMCEVKGSTGLAASSFEYVITSKGSERAREQMDRSAYIGAAPVSWDQYIASVHAQGSRKLRVNPRMMHQSLSHLVLNESLIRQIGPAVNSGKSMFLYGPPGNGKTTIAEGIGRMVLGNDMYIPYAIDVDGQIIKMYDEINHVAIKEDEGQKRKGPLGASAEHDGRWLKIRRPVIMVGGELTMAGLDLVYDTNNKYYEAPFQMKANGGMFLVDDFGRQQIRPRDLLNRWIVPMEKNIDFLALHTGQKIEVPFAVLLVFCTNLPPGDLVDEAFLRRIRHKVEVISPSFDEYREIFQIMCEHRGIPFDEQAVRYLIQEHYIKKSRKVRGSHPRDIIDQILDISSYLGNEPRLTKELLDQAANAYFVDL